MVFTFDITVTHGTSKATKEETVLSLAYGIITQFELAFPKGCRGLVKVVINRALHQVFPNNTDHQFTGDGVNLVYPCLYDLREQPHQLEACCWNEDDTFDHTVTVRFVIQPPWALNPFTDQMYHLTME